MLRALDPQADLAGRGAGVGGSGDRAMSTAAEAASGVPHLIEDIHPVSTRQVGDVFGVGATIGKRLRQIGELRRAVDPLRLKAQFGLKH